MQVVDVELCSRRRSQARRRQTLTAAASEFPIYDRLVSRPSPVMRDHGLIAAISSGVAMTR